MKTTVDATYNFEDDIKTGAIEVFGPMGELMYWHNIVKTGKIHSESPFECAKGCMSLYKANHYREKYKNHPAKPHEKVDKWESYCVEYKKRKKK